VIGHLEVVCTSNTKTNERFAKDSAVKKEQWVRKEVVGGGLENYKEEVEQEEQENGCTC